MIAATDQFRPGSGKLMAGGIVAGAIVVSTILLYSLQPDQRYVAAPALVALNVAIAFFAVLRAQLGELPLREVGAWHVAAVVIYTVMPLYTYLANNQTYTVFSDIRLWITQPDALEVGT